MVFIFLDMVCSYTLIADKNDHKNVMLSITKVIKSLHLNDARNKPNKLIDNYVYNA